MFPQMENFHISDNGLYYGLYGGLDYSAGTEDGTITGTSADPTPSMLTMKSFTTMISLSRTRPPRQSVSRPTLTL
jgi:hypothetical protein